MSDPRVRFVSHFENRPSTSFPNSCKEALRNYSEKNKVDTSQFSASVVDVTAVLSCLLKNLKGKKFKRKDPQIIMQ